jgi:hypothetical protein
MRSGSNRRQLVCSLFLLWFNTSFLWKCRSLSVVTLDAGSARSCDFVSWLTSLLGLGMLNSSGVKTLIVHLRQQVLLDVCGKVVCRSVLSSRLASPFPSDVVSLPFCSFLAMQRNHTGVSHS